MKIELFNYEPDHLEFMDESQIDYEGMFFGISEEKLGGYSSVTRVFKPMKYKDYIHELKKQVNRNPKDFIDKPFKRYAYITGRVKRGVLQSLDKYLMLLDSDSIDGKNKATEWLNKRNIKHFCVQSTPNKFWIICDKIGYVSDHTYMMDEIPGLDTRYTDCSRRQDVLLYRGFPKPGFVPHFGDVKNLDGSPQFKKWVLRFKKYWESDDMMEISNNLFAEAL